MTQKTIVAAKKGNGKAIQAGYSISEKEAAKLRVPVRADITPEQLAKARSVMASVWGKW